jgi:hypothetical protein
MNEKTKYNANLLTGGFAEGFYSPENDYGSIEGSEMKEGDRHVESVEDMVKDTENLLKNARGQ